MIPKIYIKKPESLPDPPAIEGYHSVFAGRGVYPAMLPRGVKKFAITHVNGKEKWKVIDYKKDLIYPIGDAKMFYALYFNA